MKIVKNNLKNLEHLCKCTNTQRKAILKNANKELIQCISECVLNCLNGNIHLMKDEKTKLQKFKNNLRDLVKSRQSLKNQRNILIQKGGYILPVILPAIIESLKLLFTK
jgi:hypothetical protein